MNQEITLNDYQSIGTMETALSEHADEAFFELSPERQKIAEKIFKCLTETDGENREIRRAMTVEKLCAVADADFSEVASVIEVFRKEGRTFLMPPPEVPLNKNSLIDISHESLIRKWERLKNWVEEEGQSSRTYRRLAEDALLHQQNKMGFWNDPELKDALEWREAFKPNETWAQLYKETGEKQYKASFADSMQYLDESEIKRDEEIAKERRQQDTLRKNARNLRWMLAGLGIFSILTIGVAIFAFSLMNEAVETKNELIEQKSKTEEFNLRLKKNSIFLQDVVSKLKAGEVILNDALKNQKKATDEAKNQKERADKEADQAKRSNADKQAALIKQEQLAVEAEKKKEEAVESLKRAKATTEREELNRTGLTLLEQDEFKSAKTQFENLLAKYEKGADIKADDKINGKWWALHNLGIANLNQYYYANAESSQYYYANAKSSYENALKALNAASGKKTERRNELNFSYSATYRRLAQLSRERAKNATNHETAESFNWEAINYYTEWHKIWEKAPVDKQPSNLADVSVEIADIYFDLSMYKEAKEFYKHAADTYAIKEDYDKQVEVLRKWSDAALTREEVNHTEESKDINATKEDEDAVTLLEKAISIQENKMNLPPISLEIAESYDQLNNAYIFANQNDANFRAPYDKLINSIRTLNYTVNKTDDISAYDVRDLAINYLKIGKCRRAEEVYIYAIKRAEQESPQGKKLRYKFTYLYFYVELAELYQNVLHDDKKAQEKFDVFAANSEKGKPNDEKVKPGYETPSIGGEFFEKAGDFYFSKKDYLQAGKFYGYALHIVEKERRRIEKIDENMRNGVGMIMNSDEEIEKYWKMATLNNAEVIVKTARLDEAQNKLAEAEAKYPLAINLAAKKFGETDIATVRFLLYQADFYGRRGTKEKATEIYNKADAILNNDNAGKFPKQKLALQIHIQRKFGDINSDNTAIAAKYYEKAMSNLGKYYYIQIDTDGDCSKKCETAEEVTRYTKNGKQTEENWIDEAEILEAWANLKGVENAAELKKKAQSAHQRLLLFKCQQCNDDEPSKNIKCEEIAAKV